MYAIVEIFLLCTIVEKNVNDSRDFRLYLWLAVNVRITVQNCRWISLSVATIKLSSKLPHDGFGTVVLSTAAFIATTIRMQSSILSLQCSDPNRSRLH